MGTAHSHQGRASCSWGAAWIRQPVGESVGEPSQWWEGWKPVEEAVKQPFPFGSASRPCLIHTLPSPLMIDYSLWSTVNSLQVLLVMVFILSSRKQSRTGVTKRFMKTAVVTDVQFRISLTSSYKLYKVELGLGRWFGLWRCLPETLTTWVRSHGLCGGRRELTPKNCPLTSTGTQSR